MIGRGYVIITRIRIINITNQYVCIFVAYESKNKIKVNFSAKKKKLTVSNWYDFKHY